MQVNKIGNNIDQTYVSEKKRDRNIKNGVMLTSALGVGTALAHVAKRQGFSLSPSKIMHTPVKDWAIFGLYNKNKPDRKVLNLDNPLDIIEIALKRTTSKANPSFDYLDKLLSDWHDRGFTTTEEIQKFLLEMKEKNKNVQNLEKTAGYNKYEQRSYDNLNNLYANVKKKQEA